MYVVLIANEGIFKRICKEGVVNRSKLFSWKDNI